MKVATPLLASSLTTLFVFNLTLAPISAWTAELGIPNRALIETSDGNDDTPAMIELGKVLFFDSRLSINRNQSCASCHNPDLGFSDGRAKGLGTMGNTLGRNTPHLYNLAWNQVLFWDGRAHTLEEQALGPIQAAGEMAMPLPLLEKRLDSVAYYRKAFKAIYGTAHPTKDGVARSLAAFQRSLIVDNTPFDRFVKGDTNAMSTEAKRGLNVFKGAGRCIVCHDGPNFTDQSFHNLGHAGLDEGRAKIAGDASLKGAFKTPGLRNILFSAPYMHDGSMKSLEDVVEYYNRGGDVGPNKSKLMQPLKLTDIQKQDLIAFLGALSQPLTIQPPAIP